MDFNNILCLHLLLAFTLSASRKYDLEQQSNKLFGKTLSQVLEEFRGTPEYLEILRKRVSNWKKSTKYILMALDEHQTNKFLKAVASMNDEVNPESTENFRRNLKENNKKSVELLDSNSYAKLTSDEKVKVINIAYKHIGMFLHSYMVAVSPEGVSLSFGNGTSLSSLVSSFGHDHRVPEVKSHEVLKIPVNKNVALQGVDVSKKEVVVKQEAPKQEEKKEGSTLVSAQEKTKKVSNMVTPNETLFGSINKTVVNNVTFISEETLPK